jgi:pimeloyl-ACP methyl ester carboxylesterase
VRRVGRFAKFLLLGVLALIAAAIVALLGLRAYLQHDTARTLAIHAPDGIEESMYVRIGGIDQWIEIRGQDRRNPILLCLHGGPGGTWTPLTALFQPWEAQFTVVQWDQRGAGKTLESTGDPVAATMSIRRMADDGIEVAEYLRRHLHQDRIVLLGHSWGSILGVDMARRRPDLFLAYVGTGQVSSMPASLQSGYTDVLRKAREAHDSRALDELEKIGAPPFDGMDKVATYFRYLGAYAPASDRMAESELGRLAFRAPNHSLWDLYNRIRGFTRVPTWSLYQAMLSTDLESQDLRFEIPVFFFQGSEDMITPAPLAREYFDRIEAPRKEFVLLEGGGHFAVWAMPERLLRELLARVRPLAAAGAAAR